MDVCLSCEELNIKIKSPTLYDVAKRAAVAELMVHKRRASKFYSKFREITDLCRRYHLRLNAEPASTNYSSAGDI